MNFNAFFLKSFRVLLLPFAIEYGIIIFIRNKLLDKNFLLHETTFNFPLICIGNVAVGGTGKSPIVEYLLSYLHPTYKVATLSRGYKRKTKGYALANENATALEIGDEPMQFHLKFPNVPVAVGEERLVAIPQLLHDVSDLQVIIFDDALQHRAVKAGLNIVLSDYNNLYIYDFFLPTGDLRDERRSVKRADIIIVTKCPPDLTFDKKQKILCNLHSLNTQLVFFTTIEYDTPYHIITHELKPITENDEVLLVCGIANPKPLKDYLHQQAATYYQKNYNDQHIFTIDDLKEIIELYKAIDVPQKMILTTEKDAVSLTKFKQKLVDLPLYVLPIKHIFLYDEASLFESAVEQHIVNFNKTHEQAKK
jgi:tetraacyldisaccharide 4'-kinase